MPQPLDHAEANFVDMGIHGTCQVNCKQPFASSAAYFGK